MLRPEPKRRRSGRSSLHYHCWLLQYGLVAHFSTSRARIHFRRAFGSGGGFIDHATAANPATRRTRSATKAVVFSFVYLRALCGRCFVKLHQLPQPEPGFFSPVSRLQSALPVPSSEGALLLPNLNLPTDFNTNLLMLFRWLHFSRRGLARPAVLLQSRQRPVHEELDPATKSKILPSLMSRTLWWFRWGSVLTVLTGLAYWGSIVASDARNADANVAGNFRASRWEPSSASGP